MNKLKGYQIFLLFFLLLTIFAMFLPMIDASYAFTDDWVLLQSYSGELKNISFNYILNTFTHYHEGLYHPLVTLSYSLETTIFGFVSATFHFDNIMLHIANVILVFLIFFKLSKSFWLSFIITILFAIHPTRAEVVCWISARKDLLYSFFYLLSVLFYIKTYDGKKTKVYLILSVIMFLSACFSKVMAVTLPFVLILIDFYTNNFKKQNFKIHSIYILITSLFVFLNVYAHYFSNNGISTLNFNLFNPMINFINAHFNILFYLDKLLLPINLYCMYPFFYNKFTMPPVYILYSPAILYILIYFSFLSLRRTRTIFYGFTFFIITILPSSNIFPIGDFAVADRYTYIPYLGLFFIFAKAILYVYNKHKNYIRILIISCGIIIFITLGYLLYKRVIDWQQNDYEAPTNMEYYKFGIKK